MKNTSLLCILCLLLLAATCKKQEKLESELLGKTWLHSFEEDEGDVRVYRPNSYDFPASRGRTGFALEQGGVLKRYAIAPTDGLEEHRGQWEFLDDKVVHIKVKGDSTVVENFTIQILSLKNNVLKVKRQPAQDE